MANDHQLIKGRTDHRELALTMVPFLEKLHHVSVEVSSLADETIIYGTYWGHIYVTITKAG